MIEISSKISPKNDEISCDKILVTGATGNTGIEVIKFLKMKNLPVIAALRNPERDKNILPEGIGYIKFDFEKPETYMEALTGIKKVYLVRPPAISNMKKYLKPVIEACKEAGVSHIVFLSLIGVENNSFTPHYKVEKYILESGIPYTFIRPSFFMQNLSTTHKEDIKLFNQVFVPAGRGKTSFIDARDISEIVALILSESGHKNKVYELTGNQALDYYQVAEILSNILGRKITYTNPSMISFFIRMKKRKTNTGFIMVMIAIYSVAKLGKAGMITKEVKNLLGREPISFKQFTEYYKETWDNSK